MLYTGIKITYFFLSKLLKIDENDQNAYVNIFQGTIDMNVIVFVGFFVGLEKNRRFIT